MKKLALLTAFILANCLLESCLSNIETCYSLDIKAVKNFDLISNQELTAEETVAADEYAVLLDGTTMNQTCMANYSFGGALLAEDPVYTLIDEVSNISITSTADLTAVHPAGSELKELFIPLSLYRSCLENATDPAECRVDYFADESYDSLEDALNGLMSESIFFGGEDDVQLFALSAAEPIAGNTHQFTIQFDFRSGTTIELETEPIVLN